MKKNITFRNSVFLALVAAFVAAALQFGNEKPSVSPGEATQAPSVIVEAYEAQKSGVWAETDGKVIRILPDDNDGSRHQRFIIELDSGLTVLVAHNIDLAERLPLKKNDRISLRGRYEWNNKGGVLHWTHHDPEGRHDGGWIEYQGRRYF